MCVTANPAIIQGTRTYVYATSTDPLGWNPVHVCGYQNEAETLDGANCMFLNFAGDKLKLVRGPEHTQSFMSDMTARLPELVYVPRTRGGSFSFGAKGLLSVEDYGDYTVILSQGPGDILSALDEVPLDRRPQVTPRLRDMIDFYMSFFAGDSFVLACWNGKAKPKHPVTVQYHPRNPDVLTIPGLDGHDGRVPVIGAPVYRDFRIAFGIAGEELAQPVTYRDDVAGQFWAPPSVAGFVDNRTDGKNGDYVVPVSAVKAGLHGIELADTLIEPAR
jgi:hypothetical protein